MNSQRSTIEELEPVKSVTVMQSVSYALPLVSCVMLLTPMYIVQGIYAKHYGISLGVLAIVIMLSRIFDAISDPIIGYYSDRYRIKHGTRKPFIVVGCLSLLVCGYFLYSPPATISTFYVGFWFIAFYIAYTLFEIPHISWPCDITTDAKGKAGFYSYRTIAGYIGLILFYSVPLLPFFPSKEITPETLKVAFYVAAFLAIPFLIQAIKGVPDGTLVLPVKELKKRDRLNQLRSSLAEIASNKPFLLFIGAYLFGGFSLGMWYGLIYIYVDAYLKMGDQFAQMFLAAFVAGILVTPVWYQLAIRYSKKYIWLCLLLMVTFSYVYTGTLNPGETSFIELITLKIIQTCAFAGGNVILPVMLSEIIDYGHWRDGSEKSATYFSVRVFLEKTANAIGAGLALLIASWFGFSVTENGLPAESIFGLKVAIAWVPSLLALISLVFVLLTPINERRHKIIRARLDARLARRARDESREANTPKNIQKETHEAVGVTP